METGKEWGGDVSLMHNVKPMEIASVSANRKRRGCDLIPRLSVLTDSGYS